MASSGGRPRKRAAVAAVIAFVFGLATVAAGTRVLLGADPGYAVFRPLLWFNTSMGLAYLAVALFAWRGSRWGTRGAAAIALLNLVVLGVVVYLHGPAGPVASTSVQAMAFRTAVWVAIFLLLVGSGRAHRTEREKR
jgi:hypothetical protein